MSLEPQSGAFDVYIQKCIEDACKSENRQNDGIEYQCFILKKELIFAIKCKYARVRRRIEFRLLHNLKKNFGFNFNLVYPNAFKESEEVCRNTLFDVESVKNNYVSVNYVIDCIKLFDKEYYLLAYSGNSEELGTTHINRLQSFGFPYPEGTWEEYLGAYQKAYGISPLQRYIKDIYPKAANIRAARSQYVKDLAEHDCGYWSVCFEHGYACPCSPTSAVKRGFSMNTWNSLKRNSD